MEASIETHLNTAGWALIQGVITTTYSIIQLLG